MTRFAPFAPYPLKGNGAKAKDRQRGRTTLLGVGWFLPTLPLGWRRGDETRIGTQDLCEGIKLRLAKTDRVSGWAEILQRLGDGEAKILPGLFI